MLKKFVLVTAFALIACGDDGNGTGPTGDPSVSLSADSINLAVGASTTVNVVVQNASATPTVVSRNSDIVTVTTAGGISITGVNTGSTFVIASLPDFPNARDSVRVVVTGTNNPGQVLQLPVLGLGAVPERFTAEVAAAGTIAYTTTWGFRTLNGVNRSGNAIKIWNVAGNTPQLIDSLIVPLINTIGDVQISDDGSLLVAALEGGNVNNGVVIYSRTNPTSPTLLHRFSHTNASPGVHTLKLGRINNRLYAFLSVNDGRLMILDLGNPASPTVIFNAQIANSIHDVFIRDGVLFTAIWTTGVRIYDVGGAGRGGSPGNPVALGTVQIARCKDCQFEGPAHNVWWFHDPVSGSKRYAFVGEENMGSVGSQSASGAVHVIDVSNFDAPTEVAVFDIGNRNTANGQIAGAHNFVMDEQSGILYAAYYNGGVRAIDVRGDLSACTAAQKTADGRCDLIKMGREVGVALNSGPPKYVWGVARVGTSLYASDMWNGLYKIDISGLQR